MYEVFANSICCTFEKEEDAINAFIIAVRMIENVEVEKLKTDIKYCLDHGTDNMFEYNNYMSIRRLN